MTFKQVLKCVKSAVSSSHDLSSVDYNKKMLVTTKRGLSQYKRQYKKYVDENQKLINEDNFDFSMLHVFEKECEIIEDILENAVIYK